MDDRRKKQYRLQDSWTSSSSSSSSDSDRSSRQWRRRREKEREEGGPKRKRRDRERRKRKRLHDFDDSSNSLEDEDEQPRVLPETVVAEIMRVPQRRQRWKLNNIHKKTQKNVIELNQKWKKNKKWTVQRGEIHAGNEGATRTTNLMANRCGGGAKQWWQNNKEAQAALIFEGRRCIYSAADLGF